MKRTFPANINGKIFYIDEDAYNLLQNYFTQLRSAFPGAEGIEIVDDIEARISEIFDDKVGRSGVPIVIADVNEVIERMGSPEALSGHEHVEAQAPEQKEEDQPFISINLPRKKTLYRDVQHRVLGGVVSGLSNYLGWNCNLMRLFLVVLVFVPYTMPWLLILYLLAWMIVPPAQNSRQILEMQGRSVTVDGVGRTVLDETVPPPYNGNTNQSRGFWGFVGSFLSVLGKCAMILLLVIGGCLAIASVLFLICTTVALVMAAFFSNYALADGLGFDIIQSMPYMELWCGIIGSLVAFVPAIAMMWTAACVLFNRKGATLPTIITAVVIEILLVAALIIVANLAANAPVACVVTSMPVVAYLA
ncbi:MAG: PspC domain-containing protein [Muribaculaceae bacterium]|nr:PspC domain-containing protein [Muribaculaceae bacterium]